MKFLILIFIWKDNADLILIRKRAFCILSCLVKPSKFPQRKRIRRNLIFLQKFMNQKVRKILAAQIIISRNGAHLQNILKQLQNRHIKCAPAQIKHQKTRICPLLIQTIGNCRRSRLTDNTFYFQPRKLSGTLCRLPALIIKICRHADNRFRNLFLQIRLRVLLERTQHKRRKLLRIICMVPKHVLFVRSHKTLKDVCRPVRMQQTILLCRFPHGNHSLFVYTNHRWRQWLPKTVRNNFCPFITVIGAKTVCCS